MMFKSEDEVVRAIAKAFESNTILSKDGTKVFPGKWTTKKVAKKSETGWDLVLTRNARPDGYGRFNLVVEVKFVTNKPRSSYFDPSIAAVLLRRDEPETGRKVGYCLAFNKGIDKKRAGGFFEYIRSRVSNSPRSRKGWRLLKHVGAKYVFIVDDDDYSVTRYLWKDFLKKTARGGFFEC